jgi:hypothetical protein
MRTAAHSGLPFVPNRASMLVMPLVSGILPDSECGLVWPRSAVTTMSRGSQTDC